MKLVVNTTHTIQQRQHFNRISRPLPREMHSIISPGHPLIHSSTFRLLFFYLIPFCPDNLHPDFLFSRSPPSALHHSKFLVRYRRFAYGEFNISLLFVPHLPNSKLNTKNSKLFSLTLCQRNTTYAIRITQYETKPQFPPAPKVSSCAPTSRGLPPG